MLPAILSPGHSPARLTLIAVLVLVAISPSLANPDDTRWRSGFGLPVPDRPINALMPHNGLLVVGGWFTSIGDMDAPGIAAWDGNSWSRLGTYPRASVRELATYSGGLLAMDFESGVHRWDGSQWSSLPSLPPWVVAAYDLATFEDRVAVSVRVSPDGPTRSRVLLLTGPEWTTLGGEFAGQVNALAWYDGALYAGGIIDSVGGTDIPCVVRWDGAAWQAVGTELRDAFESVVWDLVVYGGELVASGSFSDKTNPIARWLAVRWNGTQWAGLGAGNSGWGGWPSRLRVAGSDLFALGQYQFGLHPSAIARWDGSSWHFEEDSLRAGVQDIADYKGDLYAGGDFLNEGSRPAPHLVHRHGGRWESLMAPSAAMRGLLGGYVGGLVSMNGTIVAGGGFELAGTPGGWLPCARTARWDGARWSSLGMESFFNHLVADLVMHEGALHAVGSFSTRLGSGHAVRLENGEWRVVGPGDTQFLNVDCAESALGWLIVGGNNPDYGGLAYWNGRVWDRLGGGITRGHWVSAITAHGGDVIVAGWFEELGNVPVHNIAAWTPSGWRPLGAGLDEYVSDLLSMNGTLYASGYFPSLGYGASGVVRWKDGRWEPLPASGPVRTLGSSRGRLVASGYGLPGMVAVLGADSTWHPLGSGLNDIALSIFEQGSSLFFGGRFSQAGGHAAYGFAEYREDGVFPPLPSLLLSAAPNPSAEAVTLSYSLATATQVRVEIFDLAGKLVDRPFVGTQNAGPQEVVWRPAPDRVRAGVYFARLITDDESRVVRVVRVH